MDSGSCRLCLAGGIHRDHSRAQPGDHSASRFHGVAEYPAQSLCLSGVFRVPFPSRRLLAGEPLEERTGAYSDHPDRGGRCHLVLASSEGCVSRS